MKKEKKIFGLLVTFIISGVILLKDPILAFAADFNIGTSYENSYGRIEYDVDSEAEIVKVGDTYTYTSFQYSNRPTKYALFFSGDNNYYAVSADGNNFTATGELYSNDTSKPIYEASLTIPTPGSYSGLDVYEYWRITNLTISFDTYSYLLEIHVEPYEYIEPTLSLTCDKTSMSIGEESTCKIKAHTNTSIYRASFKLEPIGYTITTITEGSNFNAITNNDGVYSVEKKEDAERVTSETDVEIATFKIKLESDNVEDVANNIQLKNVSFTDGAGNNTVEDIIAATITKGSNPKTGTIIFKGFLIILMIMSGIGIVLIIKNKKTI